MLSVIYRVNFQKIIPKSGLFKSSEVFKHLNDEAVKTKSEKENESKRWTTFMQTPNRPIPKSPQQLESERRQKLRYQIKICKQPKPKCDPNREPSPEKPKIIEPEPESVKEVVKEQIVEQVESVIEPEEVKLEELVSSEIKEEVESQEVNVGAVEAEEVADEETAEETVEPIRIKSEEEQMLEKQLSDVQKQLLALSTLPLTIQATLDAVTKQLAQLMPALNQQQLQTNDTEITALAAPIITNEGMQISPY